MNQAGKAYGGIGGFEKKMTQGGKSQFHEEASCDPPVMALRENIDVIFLPPLLERCHWTRIRTSCSRSFQGPSDLCLI